MKKIGQQLFGTLEIEASLSPRKRSHRNLHNSFQEKVQRLLISLEKNSYVEPHFHELEHQWEMFVVLEGVIEVTLYSEDGSVFDSILVGDGKETKIVELSPNDIHSVKCVSDRALILEVKEGPFDPEHAKCFPNF